MPTHCHGGQICCASKNRSWSAILPCWGAVWAQCVRVVSPRVRGRLGRKDSELKPTCCSCQVLQVEIAAKHASYAGINESRVTNQLKLSVWLQAFKSVCGGVCRCIYLSAHGSAKEEEKNAHNQPTIQADLCRQRASFYSFRFCSLLGGALHTHARTRSDTMGTVVHAAELPIVMLADSHARSAIQIDANGLNRISAFLDTVCSVWGVQFRAQNRLLDVLAR